MPVLQQVPANDYVANGSVTSFPYTFQTLQASDLDVYVDGVQITSGFTVSGIGNAGGGSVEFAVAPLAGKPVRLVRATTINRTTDYVEGGYVPAETLDTDLDRLVMMVQEVSAGNLMLHGDGRYDAQHRRIKNVADPVNDADAVNKLYLTNLTAESIAITTEKAAVATDRAEFANEKADVAYNYASISTAKADQAEASSVAAANSASQADASRVAAQVAANSVMWNDVVFKSFSDSPISVTAGDAGKLFAIDTTGGPVVVNLPVIAGLPRPFSFGIRKQDSSVNQITVNRAGTDTINGQLTESLSTQNVGKVFVPDEDPSPDTWIPMTFGSDLPDGSVSTAKIVDGHVTLAKMATSAYGTSGANKLLQLDAAGKLPAVDGSQLTGITPTGAASTIYTTNVTPSMALVSDSSGKVTASTLITSTELDRLDGVTSNIQAQINTKLDSVGGALGRSGNQVYLSALHGGFGPLNHSLGTYGGELYFDGYGRLSGIYYAQNCNCNCQC